MPLEGVCEHWRSAVGGEASVSSGRARALSAAPSRRGPWPPMSEEEEEEAAEVAGEEEEESEVRVPTLTCPLL